MNNKHVDVKQYAVYAHYYEDQLFYIGSGRVYRNSRGLRGRPFDFTCRSPEWFSYCKGETYKIKVQILFVTNDKRESLDKEEEITKAYMEKGYKLANKDIGVHPGVETRNKMSEAQKGKKHSAETKSKISEACKGRTHSEEARSKMSLAVSGENNPNYGKRGKDSHMYGKTTANAKKVLLMNNESGESKVFDSITKACEFIVENGFDKAQTTLQRYLNKGKFAFKNYTLEIVKDMSSE